MPPATLLVLIFALFVVSSSGLLQKHLIKNYTKASARCLDGTPGAYYIQPSATGSNRWLVYMQGGGVCADKTSCTKRSGSDLGSSKSWPQTIYPSNLAKLPDFKDDNLVYIPYCCGDLHSGTRTSVSEDTWGLWFTGHNIVKATLEELSASHNYDKATEIIVSGGSAGGIGVFVNLDFFAEYSPNARVVGQPNAGWFLIYPQYGNPSVFPVGDLARVGYDLYQSYANQACIKAQESYKTHYLCIGQRSYKYQTNAMYIAEAMYDTNQIYTQNGCPRVNTTETQAYIEKFGQTMRSSLAQVETNPDDGVFLASCLIHGVPTELSIDGLTYGEGFTNWYFNRNGRKSAVDTCDGIACNPSCNLRRYRKH